MGIGLFINLKYERTRSGSVRKLIKKIICIFFFIGLLAGPLFAFGNKSLKAPQADKKLASQTVLRKLFVIIGKQYSDKKGGYTRIYHLPPRRGDASEMALIQLV